MNVFFALTMYACATCMCAARLLVYSISFITIVHNYYIRVNELKNRLTSEFPSNFKGFISLQFFFFFYFNDLIGYCISKLPIWCSIITNAINVQAHFHCIEVITKREEKITFC